MPSTLAPISRNASRIRPHTLFGTWRDLISRTSPRGASHAMILFSVAMHSTMDEDEIAAMARSWKEVEGFIVFLRFGEDLGDCGLLQSSLDRFGTQKSSLDGNRGMSSSESVSSVEGRKERAKSSLSFLFGDLLGDDWTELAAEDTGEWFELSDVDISSSEQTSSSISVLIFSASVYIMIQCLAKIPPPKVLLVCFTREKLYCLRHPVCSKASCDMFPWAMSMCSSRSSTLFSISVL
mmetsp:Transcript_20833/g.30526  ORF Transcript_20833/g.30526 Transcript_20833/m.30526 type:complete len:237 (-) Transcript_20833:254-964(-)